MSRNHQSQIDVMNMLLRFMILFTTLSLFTLVSTNNVLYVWKTLILFQASILSFLINKFTKHIWSYIGLHLVLLTCYLFVANDHVLRVFYTLFIISYAVMQFTLELKDKLVNTPLAFLAVFFLMYFFCQINYSEEKMLNWFFFFFTIIYGLIYVVNRHLVNYTIYLKKHEEKPNIPLKQINNSNNLYITGFVILSFIAALLFSKFVPIGSLLRYIGLFLRDLLRRALLGLSKGPEEIEFEEITPPIEMVEEGSEFNYQVINPPEILIKALKVLLALSFALFVALLISLIIYGLYRIYKLYYQTRGNVREEEKIEVLSPFEAIGLGFLSGSRAFRKNMFSYFSQSNNEKIRKQYLKAIQMNTKTEKNLHYYMPEELSKYAIGKRDNEDKVLGKGTKVVKKENKEQEIIKEYNIKDVTSIEVEKTTKQENEKRLTALYEKARYSNKACSKEDVQSVKNILK